MKKKNMTMPSPASHKKIMEEEVCFCLWAFRISVLLTKVLLGVKVCGFFSNQIITTSRCIYNNGSFNSRQVILGVFNEDEQRPWV